MHVMGTVPAVVEGDGNCFRVWQGCGYLVADRSPSRASRSNLVIVGRNRLGRQDVEDLLRDARVGVLFHGIGAEGVSAATVSSRSATAVAELFLAVIVRHVPGRMAGEWLIGDQRIGLTTAVGPARPGAGSFGSVTSLPPVRLNGLSRLH